MTASLSLSRLSNILRGRVTLVHEIPAIYQPNIARKKEKLMEVIRGNPLYPCVLSILFKCLTVTAGNIRDQEKAEIASKSELARKMRVLKGFYTLELAPPSLKEMEKLRSDVLLAQEFFKTNCFNYLTVRQAWLLFLVCTEIFLWFFLGETIGKGHIVGYSV